MSYFAEVDNGGSPIPVSGTVNIGNMLVTVPFDYISLQPTGTNPTTIIYKLGGASGTTVATLTLTYDANGNAQTITKS